MPVDDWPRSEKYVNAELTRLSEGIDSLRSELEEDRNERRREHSKIELELAMLKVRAGAWGAISGAVTALAAAIVSLFAMRK